MNAEIKLGAINTEARNKATEAIDTLSTLEMVKVINDEDAKVAASVEKFLPQIAETIDAIVHAFEMGGRLIYMGAGTSGRLGVLDASECPPTFGVPSSLVVGLIAGGKQAVFSAVENAEDNVQGGEEDLKNIHFSNKDVLVGIAASGRTPYVIGGMNYAKNLGAKVACLCCSAQSPMSDIADITIAPTPGAEVVTGSTRLKSGTAQKLVLNMLTTGAMIRIGKVFGNLMVDVEATNLKLIERQVQIVISATQASREVADNALNEANRHCKTAILMILKNIDAAAAKAKLADCKGRLRKALA